MKTWHWVLIVLGILSFFPLLVAGGIISFGANYARKAANVVAREIDPAVLLQKYEWFKDAAAALDKKQADIGVYQSRIRRLEQDYEGQKRSQWAREDREQMSVWQSEVAGVKASYNTLAAEYNSQMAKWNWQFTNIGSLPAGAKQPLPREYRSYTEE